MISIIAGALIRKHVRNFLKKLIYMNYKLEYQEYKNFFESEFLIKCEHNVSVIINNWMEKIDQS